MDEDTRRGTALNLGQGLNDLMSTELEEGAAPEGGGGPGALGLGVPGAPAPALGLPQGSWPR